MSNQFSPSNFQDPIHNIYTIVVTRLPPLDSLEVLDMSGTVCVTHCGCVLHCCQIQVPSPQVGTHSEN